MSAEAFAHKQGRATGLAAVCGAEPAATRRAGLLGNPFNLCFFLWPFWLKLLSASAPESSEKDTSGSVRLLEGFRWFQVWPRSGHDARWKPVWLL